MTDAEKLRTLATWFDTKDDQAGYTGVREVQQDLRRIASRLEELEPQPRIGRPPKDDIRPGKKRYNKVICVVCDNGYKPCEGICDD